VISPDDYIDVDQLDLLRGVAYNPSAIQVGKELFVYVQAITLDPDARPNLPWDWCPDGENVVRFHTPFTSAGLRRRFQVGNRVSPCFGGGSTHYGVGGVLFSSWDSQYKIFLDRAYPDQVFAAGHFKEIWMRSSPDGINWYDPPGVNPFVRQSQVGPDLISIIDVTLTAAGSRWWGFFVFGTIEANKVGRMRVIRAPLNARGFVVQMLSGGLWKNVKDDGSFDFKPDSVWSGFPNSIIWNDGQFEVWTGSFASATAGCDDGIDADGTLAYRTATESGMGPLQSLSSAVRAMPSRNWTGRMFPARLNHGAEKILLSASTDRACETFDFWPGDWHGANWAGMEIVLTVLDAPPALPSLIADDFTNATPAQDPGDRLDGTLTPTGGRRWSARPSVVFGDGDITNVGSDASHVAGVPFVPSQHPNDPVATVEAMVTPRGGNWIGVGFSRSATREYWSDGQLWMLLWAGGAWNVLANGTAEEIDDGRATVFFPDDFNHLKLQYDAGTERLDAWINDEHVVAGFNVASLRFTPDIRYAGFHLRNPSLSQRTMKLDDFAVTVGGEPGPQVAIQDGFTNRSPDRDPGDPLTGTVAEVGGTTWSALSGAISQVGGVPFTPPAGVSSVEADVVMAGSEWVGIGFSNRDRGGYWTHGQAWMLLRPGGGFTVFGNGTQQVLLRGRVQDYLPNFNPAAWNRLRIDYDRARNAVSAWINGVLVVDQRALSFTPNIQHAGFHLYNLATGTQGQMKLDNFVVRVAR
jgi:hypothetical protein